MYITTNYIENIKGLKIDFSLRQSWKIYKELFVIIDEALLDMVWKKSMHRELRNQWGHLSTEEELKPIYHWEWLNLFKEE